MASGGYPIKYEVSKKITGVEDVKQNDELIVFQAGTKLINEELYTAGGRVLAVTALADEFKEVIEKAYAGVEKINFEDYHIRSDIGHKALTKA